jgi:hypothetical protein
VAARSALDEARRQIRRPTFRTPAPEIDAAGHEQRDNAGRRHRAELAARDATIEQQRRRIAELEYEVRRLVTALEVVTALPVREGSGLSTPEGGGQ